jgi:hypothetical protein
MKGMLVAMAGLGIGGAAYAGADSPDFDQQVRMSRAEVYAAFSALAPEGTVTAPDSEEVGKQVSIRVTKETGDSIRYEILFDNDAVVTAELSFEATGDQQSRLTAELDIDAYQLGSAFETNAGMALAMVPESFIDAQFAQMIGEMVKEVEAGRSLQSLGLHSAGLRRGSGSASIDERRGEAEEARRAAVAPMTSGRPMVSTAPMTNPNRAAENYRSGRDQGAGGR